jgi:hypothetical protein
LTVPLIAQTGGLTRDTFDGPSGVFKHFRYPLIFNDTCLNVSIHCFNTIYKKGNNKTPNNLPKGKVKTHKYINRQNQSTTRKLGKRNDPDLAQAFPKKWWVESDFTAPNSRFHYGSKVPAVTITAFITILKR